MTEYLGCFDARQVRYIGSLLSTIINIVASYARQLRQVYISSLTYTTYLTCEQPEVAITPIANAILRLDPSGNTFTSNYLLLAQLSLESAHPPQDLPVFDRYILYFTGHTSFSKAKPLCSLKLEPRDFLTPETGLTKTLGHHDVLEYFVLCGTIHIARHDWEKALDILESAVTYPARDGAVSKIMVEAYKKWVVVHIILHGTAGKLPSTTNASVAKTLHTLATPYETVAKLFESSSALRLYREVSFGAQIWKEDRNSGLMEFLLAAYQKFQIRHLARVYRSISISEVTKLTVSAETGQNLPSNQATEHLVADMISQGTLNANMKRTADSSAVLEFNPTDHVFSESDVQEQLVASTEQLKQLADDVKSTDRRLTHEKEYLKWVSKQKSNGKNGATDGSDDFFNTNSAIAIEDEDLMATENV